MSGHSKWAQIKHKKTLADTKRGVEFGKLSRAISIAARDNPSPETNLRLQALIEKARSINMPRDNIKRAIKRIHDASAAQLDEVQLEIMGPGGVAIIINAITDNRNRTIGDLKAIATQHGGHFVKEGSLLWMFRRAGIITIRRSMFTPQQEELITLSAIEAGADDIRKDEEALYIFTTPDALKNVRTSIPSLDSPPLVEFSLISSSFVTVPDRDKQQLSKLLEVLGEHNDVQNISTNCIDDHHRH